MFPLNAQYNVVHLSFSCDVLSGSADLNSFPGNFPPIMTQCFPVINGYFKTVLAEACSAMTYCVKI